jgi:hypothetical protein
MEGNKFRFITMSQLMNSVEDDFHKWSDAGLVDQLKYIKVIRECNEKLGIRIYDSKQVMLDVYPSPDGHGRGRADLPLDFYKAEMTFALYKRFVNTMLPIGPGLQQVMSPPSLDQVQSGEITNLTGPCSMEPTSGGACSPDGPCSWLIKTPLTQLQVQIDDIARDI